MYYPYYIEIDYVFTDKIILQGSKKNIAGFIRCFVVSVASATDSDRIAGNSFFDDSESGGRIASRNVLQLEMVSNDNKYDILLEFLDSNNQVDDFFTLASSNLGVHWRSGRAYYY